MSKMLYGNDGIEARRKVEWEPMVVPSISDFAFNVNPTKTHVTSSSKKSPPHWLGCT
jgi:hypothetical protein